MAVWLTRYVEVLNYGYLGESWLEYASLVQEINCPRDRIHVVLEVVF